MNKLFKIILSVLGLIMMLITAVSTLQTNMNVGKILAFLLGAVFLFCGVFWDKIHRRIKYSFGLCLTLGLCCISALLLYGSADNVTYTEDVLIVLGTSVHGDQISNSLKSRLDTAYEYYIKNPDVIMVLSGGHGAQENISESLAMERYLIERGVSEQNLLNEDKSTSTFENFKFSKEILNEYFDKPYTTAFATNEYHIYRAESLARIIGFENISHIHSNTNLLSITTGTLRECLAVIKMWIFKQ